MMARTAVERDPGSNAAPRARQRLQDGGVSLVCSSGYLGGSILSSTPFAVISATMMLFEMPSSA
jgi:hypothetical protein